MPDALLAIKNWNYVVKVKDRSLSAAAVSEKNSPPSMNEKRKKAPKVQREKSLNI